MLSHLQVGYAITTLPEDIEPHRMVKKVYEQRRQMIDSGEGIDWGFAEALAFGTLLSEGDACMLSLSLTALCLWCAGKSLGRIARLIAGPCSSIGLAGAI